MGAGIRAGTRRERLFHDRQDAGASLAGELTRYRGVDAVVLGLPRGGIPVAAEVARSLSAELDVLVSRKLGSPVSGELAIGAVTADGERFLNDDVIAGLGVSEPYVAAVTNVQRAEAERREALFRRGHPGPRLAGRTVILVDDGLATGATLRAAIRSVRKASPVRLVAAVPVGSREACAAIRAEVDEFICLYEPPDFMAVGHWYEHFDQVEDDEVKRILDQSWR